MKKILVLVTMVALLASTVMAADVTFSGEVEYGFITDFSGDYANEAADVVQTLKAAVDDNNTLTIKLEEADGDFVEGEPSFEIDNAYFVSNLGSALGTSEMGIGISLTAGLYESDWEEVGVVTGNEVEEVVGFESETWAYGLDIGIMDMVTIRTIVGPGDGLDKLVFGAFGGYGPVTAEVFYGALGTSLDMGTFAVGVGFETEVMPMLTLAVGGEFGYDLEAADADAPAWVYGVGVAADYNDGFATAGIALNGAEETEIFALGFDLGVAPLANVGFDIAGAVVLDSDTADLLDSAIDYIEPSVWSKVGAAKFTLGYYYTPNGEIYDAAGEDASLFGSYNAKADNTAGTEGGLFFQAQLSY